MMANLRSSKDFIEFSREDVEWSIAGRFESQVESHPDRVAIDSGDGKVTYEALNVGANRVAHRLLAERGPEAEPVAVLSERDAAMVEAVLGVLKAGKIWVPVDPTYPRMRNSFILEHSQATVLLTSDRQAEDARYLASNSCPVVTLPRSASGFADTNPRVPIPPQSIACLLYTSGSTGVPKGVIHSHRTLLHLIMRYTNAMRIGSSDRLSLMSSCSHMSGVGTLLRGLLTGATLLPLDPRRLGPAELSEWLRHEAVSVWHVVPSLFRQVVRVLDNDAKFPEMRLIHLGGEQVTSGDVQLFQRHFPRSCVLLNNLGCTEISSFRQYLMDHETIVTTASVPVGYAVEDTEVLLLDEGSGEVLPGEIGEIAVKSCYLARGYWREPTLTADRFAALPGQGEQRVYRTGDLGRLLPDGCLLHLGRKDFQVQIRGYRVEAAEVEKALIDSGELEACVVIGAEDPTGETQLVAYLVAQPQQRIGTVELRTLLQGTLPSYMVPTAFVWLETLPQLPNGKLDRRALPPPDWSRPLPDEAFVAPRTAVEKAIAAIWGEVLGIEQVGLYDDFFDLGAHSLHLTRALSRIRRSLQVDLSLEALFVESTVAGLAIVVERAGLTASASGNMSSRSDAQRGWMQVDTPASARQ
jgi:amino acid adenylation domain-containing protein